MIGTYQKGYSPLIGYAKKQAGRSGLLFYMFDVKLSDYSF